MRLRFHPRTRSSSRRDSGFILLVLMLWAAVLAITVSLPMIYYYRQQMIRDREEELVHRGVEYERAVRKYYRKFGTYPASLDLLESANHMRFLRRRYKDPITGQDFKVLSQADVMVAFAAGISGGSIPGAQSLGTPVSDITSAAGAAPVQAAPAQVAPAPSPSSTSDTGTGSDSGSTPNPNPGTTLPFGAKPTPGGNNGPTFGGGGIVGVASVSKAESIRVYNKKNHYHEWLFAYNPQMDRGGLPKGPYEPSLQLLPGQMGLNGQQLNGQQGAGQPGFGQQGFGQQGLGQQGLGGTGGTMPGNRR
jgi:type II secretory pathway pseudopilin PulG